MPDSSSTPLHRAVNAANQLPIYRLAIESVYTPADIRAAIVDELSPYFQNKDVLEQMAIELLPPEAFRLARLDQDKWAKNLFLHVLNLYHAAAARNPQLCYQACADSLEDLLIATSENWSLYYLRVDDHELPLEDLRFAVYRNIGAVVEALIQPHLKDLLVHVRISRGKQAQYATIRDLELGNVVNELHSTLGLPEALAPLPWGVALNQWRNIAYHHKSKILNNKVVSRYGKSPNEKEVVLDRNELVNVQQRIYSIFDALSLAHTLFVIDNFESISPLLRDGLSLREDAVVLSLVTVLSTQGFSLTDITTNEDIVVATVQDVTDQPPKERMAHASQFVFPVWRSIPRPLVAVRFHDSKGHFLLTITGKGDDCQAVADGSIEFHELASRVDFEFASDDQTPA